MRICWRFFAARPIRSLRHGQPRHSRSRSRAWFPPFATRKPATSSSDGPGKDAIGDDGACAPRSEARSTMSAARREDSLRRAAEILQEIGGTEAASKEPGTRRFGALAGPQSDQLHRGHLDRPIRNEDLAALVRLNPSHFGRAFRNSFGEPPHEYVIRRRVERAQGLMLSTDCAAQRDRARLRPRRSVAPDAGCFAGSSGRARRLWRRARIGDPGEDPGVAEERSDQSLPASHSATLQT